MFIAVALHALAAVVWVGGMFYAYICLRPALGVLEPPAPMRLMRGILERFLPWVAVSIVVLLVTGYWAVFVNYGGFAGLPMHVNEDVARLEICVQDRMLMELVDPIADPGEEFDSVMDAKGRG